jgi:hypothetical protein
MRSEKGRRVIASMFQDGDRYGDTKSQDSVILGRINLVRSEMPEEDGSARREKGK